MPSLVRFPRSASLLAIVLVVAGCGHRLQQVLAPDGRPGVRLERLRLAPPSTDSYSYLARWTGEASARPISHYLYAIDPASIDAVSNAWVKTSETQKTLTFTDRPGGRPSHVFAVRAVDDRGNLSDPQWFAVAANNIPPTVQITVPNPNPAFIVTVPPTFRIHWVGDDPDGSSHMPVKYKYRLFGAKNPDFPLIQDFINFVLTYPDTLNGLYGPEFASWDSVPGDSNSVLYSGLNPGSTYLFAITAFDEAGDYDAIFSANKNLAHFAVAYSNDLGPLLTMFNETFNYSYPTGGWINNVSRYIPVEVPAGRPVTVNWFAEAPPGAEIAWYRWVLSPTDLEDETPRTDETTDWHHWSARNLNTTSATIGPFDPGSRVQVQHLYIDVMDNYGFRSLGIVDLVCRRPTFNHDLLFVDDTRLRPDFQSVPGSVDPPAGPWPTSAELDTFLYARGGFPYRGYPSGTVSSPGIFNGYAYDTLGTRGLPGGVTLALLSQYRHVVWYTDEQSAVYTSSPSDPSTPITELRRLSSPGSSNSLAAYILQGGQVWLLGGGAAFATLIPWNRGAPNQFVPPVLQAGRFMYDFSHWREGIRILPAIAARKFGSTSFGVGSNRPGRHWPASPPLPTPPSPPNYSLLPTNLDPKNIATDPPPPQRMPDSFWLRGTYTAEHIFVPTLVREDYNDDPNVTEDFSTLDTLYLTAGGTAPLSSPVMTYYHGRENQPLVFSGFNMWYWRRTQCIALVDWVLQSVWGIPRDAGAPRSPTMGPRLSAQPPPPSGARPVAARSGSRSDR